MKSEDAPHRSGELDRAARNEDDARRSGEFDRVAHRGEARGDPTQHHRRATRGGETVGDPTSSRAARRGVDWTKGYRPEAAAVRRRETTQSQVLDARAVRRQCAETRREPTRNAGSEGRIYRPGEKAAQWGVDAPCCAIGESVVRVARSGDQLARSMAVSGELVLVNVFLGRIVEGIL